jgi:hypothetical protein
MKTSHSEITKKKVGRPLGSKNKPNKKEKLPADQDARLNDLAQQHQQQAALGDAKHKQSIQQMKETIRVGILGMLTFFL